MNASLSTLYPTAVRARLTEAVKLRTSCRTFAAPLATAETAALNYALARYQLPGARIALFPVTEDFFTASLLGTQRITGCRMAAAVIIDNSPLARINAGILGESLVLEATSLGLGSCWVSGSYRQRGLTVSTRADEMVLCVIALGHSAQPLSAPARRTRKPPEHFCRGNFRDWPEMLLDAAALVQQAPSAMNMQPWMLWMGPNGEFVLDATDRAELDAGIALVHAELALDAPHEWHFATQRSDPLAWAVAK